jgi:hypothetical protein
MKGRNALQEKENPCPEEEVMSRGSRCAIRRRRDIASELPSRLSLDGWRQVGLVGCRAGWDDGLGR